MLVVKYQQRNFFGVMEFRQDERVNPSYDDIKKAFRLLKKDYYNAIDIGNTVLYWNRLEDFECGVLTAREYDKHNGYKEFSWDYDGCKNNYYKIYKGVN